MIVGFMWRRKSGWSARMTGDVVVGGGGGGGGG